MDPTILALLPVSVPDSHKVPEEWGADILTQGAGMDECVEHTEIDPKPEVKSVPQKTVKKTKNPKKPERDTMPFLEMFASMIDPMYQIYPYETKRDIKQHVKTRLTDWVSQNARAFFGPSTSRSISVCIRGSSEVMQADLERFAELVSFFVDAAVLVGTKVVVWHGYGSTASRDPIYTLVLKQQGVFVTKSKN